MFVERDANRTMPIYDPTRLDSSFTSLASSEPPYIDVENGDATEMPCLSIGKTAAPEITPSRIGSR